jgi:hypothetical protein
VQFDGKSLLGILEHAENAIDLRDENGGLRGPISQRLALKLAESGSYVGIGNLRRIRYLRPLTRLCALNGGSHTTRPVRADQSCRIYGDKQVIGHPRLNREYPI